MTTSYVGITDLDWFTYLKSQPDLTEVNFWKPGGTANFIALQPGEPFLFKLHSPNDYIVGGGYFGHFSKVPISIAWETFGTANGAQSYQELRARVEKFRRISSSVEDYTVGCVLLQQPFFLDRQNWIPVPEGWSKNIVQGRTYNLTESPGKELWEQVFDATLRQQVASNWRKKDTDEEANIVGGYGSPRMVRSRIGQGTFRILVTDAYRRRCTITGEKTLPVLQASHIKPFSDTATHSVRNGLLLRSDIHTLFDKGYITVTPDYRIEVSKRIRDEFSNGREYYAHHGKSIELPERSNHSPDPTLLDWHNSNIYRG